MKLGVLKYQHSKAKRLYELLNHYMNFDFTKTMVEASDSELIKIVTVDRENYQKAALDAAEKELTERNLPIEQVEKTKKLQETQKQFDEIKANAPLDTHWKVLTFIFPAVLQLIISGVFKSDGYDRKANELAKWTLYGFAFYITIVIVFVLF
ncbi:MAG: hypothetical protein JWQ09_683 [Segetibacter sp.]|nr:hypothetical protein [Segetibacter sp.]